MSSLQLTPEEVDKLQEMINQKSIGIANPKLSNKYEFVEEIV